ncbi:MAG: amidohydrolase family protein [Candidatus Kapabacteria bacterium]|nr:amidohydrolase family protein [Candidatus Kapabacteria bacterium]
MFAELHVERGRLRAILPCTTGTIVRTETDSFEYPGCHVLPGFVDNHAHIVGLGERLSLVSLHHARSEEECVQLLVDAGPASNGWVRAMGWNQEQWPQSAWPSRESLDRAFPNTPVAASRVDGHAMWVNSASLKASGIEPSGHTGILLDDEMNPVWSSIPPRSQDELRLMILAATTMCASMGITEIHDMDVAEPWLEPFRILAEQGALPVRIQTFVRAQKDEWRVAGLLPAVGEFVRLAGVKYYADGALGSRGAKLLAPYTDDSTTDGIQLLTVEEMTQKARDAVDMGWPCIAIHAIGDAAVRNVLDAYENVRSWSDGKDMILRLEHAQHVHPDDVLRMAALNVVACVQPSHCMSDARMAEQRLGPDRLPWAYRWRSLLDAGVHIGAGSDFPIESPNVLEGIEAFVERMPKDCSEAWQGQERITVSEAIAAYTFGAHATSGMEYRRGRIEVGFDADLVILDKDIASVSLNEITSAKVMATFVAGKRRYHS